MKRRTFTKGQIVEIRRRRSKDWIEAVYDCRARWSGCHVVSCGEVRVRVPDSRIREPETPDQVHAVLRTRIESAGLVVERIHSGVTTYRGGPIDGSQTYTVEVRVPGDVVRAAKGGGS